MGVGSSLPQKDSLLYVKTVEGKEIDLQKKLNEIFTWMLEKSDVLDYYALASPKECKLYVKTTEEGLKKWFKELEVKPTEDAKTGKIIFQKLDTLKRIAQGVQTTDDNFKLLTEPAQNQLCMQIAYFYIRVLQIFSALALSVLDTKIPDDYDILTVKPAATVAGRPAAAPFLAQKIQARPLQPQDIPKRKMTFQIGGEIARSSSFYIQAPSFALLNRYLSYELGVFEITDGTTKKGIQIQPTYVEQVAKGQRQNLPLGANLKDAEGKQRTILGILKMSAVEGEVNLAGDTIPSYVAEISALSIDGSKFSDSQLASFTNKATFKLKGSVFRYKNQNIAQWISNVFQKALGFEVDEEGEEEKGAGYNAKKKERKSVEKNLPDDFPDATFGLKKLSAVLKDSKPKAYCVSRALQLLSPEQLYKDLDSPARTRICNSSFALSDSSPILGKPVSEVKGLFYLEKLFYDKIVGSAPKISETLLPQHKQFMSELRALYLPSATEIQSGEVDFTKIKEEPAKLCQDKGLGEYLTKDREVIRNLRAYVGRLLNRQIQHTANVVRLLSELFIISNTEPLQLQPGVWKKGMPEVERIAGKARELLVSYYSDCEATYQEGTLYISKQADKFDK